MAQGTVLAQVPPAAEEVGAGLTSNPQALASVIGAPVSAYTATTPAVAAASVFGKPALGADAVAFMGLSPKLASQFDGYGSAAAPTSSLAQATKQFETGAPKPERRATAGQATSTSMARRSSAYTC